MPNYFFDKEHIRYELAATSEGKPYNWLFLPGGPGVDSSYIHSLLSILKLPGNVWLVDFPGSGSNTKSVTVPYNFDSWFTIFLPMVKKFNNPILVGHSFGGMFPLCFPDLENDLKGFIILNSAPSLWLAEAVSYAKQLNLPDLSQEMHEFTQTPNSFTFKRALEACMPYYFPTKSLDKGRTLLMDVPFEFLPAVWWQRKAIEMNFSAKWIPQHIPTMIIGGAYDCICPFSLFQNDARFARSNIEIIHVNDGGHLSWIENPDAIKQSFEKFCRQI